MEISKDDKHYYKISEIIYSCAKRAYEVDEKIGVGGNAAVYACIDNDGNEVAVKFLLNISKQSKARFLQETNVLAETHHPHLINLIDSGFVMADYGAKKVNIPFIVMEKADTDLKKYIMKRGQIKYEEYAPQFRGLSEALGLLHTKAIHRDIKLENILVKGGRWILSDLGLCTFTNEIEHEDLTRLHEKIGPKYWMSPEAINRIYDESEKILPASDVFQLAAVFWFVINRRYPLGNLEEFDWKSANKALYNILIKALAHNNLNRQKDGMELYSELKNVMINS